MRQEVHLGYGSLKEVRKVLDQGSREAVFIVADKAAYAGAVAGLESALAGRRTLVFSEFAPNPHLEDVRTGIDRFRDFGPDVVLAVGGGTAIDMAKLINTFAHQDADPIALVKRETRIEKKGDLLIAIPTTAGTGSEATHFAVIYVERVKYSVAHEHVLPDYAIVDPALTFGVPPAVAASTGMDALSQGIESLWSVNSTSESRRYAREAIRLAWNSLEKAVTDPDAASKASMAEAAHFSGKAINISKTTAPHALSYFFTSYFNVPHGHAVGLTLGGFLVFNDRVTPADIADGRGVAFVRRQVSEIVSILGAKDAVDASNKVDSLMQAVGLETDLSKLGFIPERDLDQLLSNVNVERLDNNPRRVEQHAISSILLKR